MAAIHRSGGLLRLPADLRSCWKVNIWPSNRVACPPLLPVAHNFDRLPLIVLPSSGRRLSTNSLPYILQPSFWRSLVPKFMRSRPARVLEEQKPQKEEWNPATFFIAIFMLIGSQAIQMIAMRRDFDKFSNQTETKLARLREVVRRIQNGEDVDVEAMLGGGDKQSEREWEDVIRELEEEDALYRQRRRKSKKPSPGDSDATASNDSAAKA